MAALEALTEEEAALLSILTDPSGSELAEFMYVDEGSPDRRYRLWDFQWEYNHCEEAFQVDALARGLGKSVSSVLRSCAFVFNYPGREMLITAPELNHLSLVTDKVEENLLKYRLLREMLPGAAKNARNNGIKKQPQFQASFVNGAKLLARLPQLSGKGVKGTHPIVIEQDELQDYGRKGFMELIETIKASDDGAMWRAHGVSNGVGDIHYELTHGKNPDLPFYVHRYIAAHRPTWNDNERRSKIAIYGGSEEAPDYVRNIFGEPGSIHNPVFVLARLMACVRINQDAWATEYNDEVYTQIKITDEYRKKMVGEGGSIADIIQLPMGHLDRDEYSSYWAGMDVGYTTDPSEILVFGVVQRRGQPDLHRLLTRISLVRISAEHQVDAIAHVFDHYGTRLRRFGMDKTGNGLPLFQILKTLPNVGPRLAGYGFSEKKPVEFDDRELREGEKPEDLVIVRSVIDFATDELRKAVDAGTLELPYDTELLGQWQGQGIQTVRSARNPGESAVRRYVGGADHTLDAARMYIAAKQLDGIEKLLEKPAKRAPVLDMFF